MRKLIWKQIGDDYELRCPCCSLRIAAIKLDRGQYEGIIWIEEYHGEYHGRSFKAVRLLVNKRIEELLHA